MTKSNNDTPDSVELSLLYATIQWSRLTLGEKSWDVQFKLAKEKRVQELIDYPPYRTGLTLNERGVVAAGWKFMHEASMTNAMDLLDSTICWAEERVFMAKETIRVHAIPDISWKDLCLLIMLGQYFQSVETYTREDRNVGQSIIDLFALCSKTFRGLPYGRVTSIRGVS